MNRVSSGWMPRRVCTPTLHPTLQLAPLLRWNYIGAEICAGTRPRRDPRLAIDVLRRNPREVSGRIRLALDWTRGAHLEVRRRAFEQRILADIIATIEVGGSGGHGSRANIRECVHTGAPNLYTC